MAIEYNLVGIFILVVIMHLFPELVYSIVVSTILSNKTAILQRLSLLKIVKRLAEI